jgi:nitrogen fixation/metabolism regulation signal transduction histidine kinase
MHESILQRDFNFRLEESDRQYPFNEIDASLNRMSALFKAISTEKEIQHRYLETLVNHVNVGLISFRDDGTVFLVNNAFLDLVGKRSIRTLSEVGKVSLQLHQRIESMGGGRTDLVKIKRDSQLLNLAVNASEFKLDDKRYRLISIQDITNELSAGEMEAWQKLIRVLTHEIMNSISPIISLSNTLHQIAIRKPNTESQVDWDTFRSGLETIQNRGEGLRQFTQRYREVTNIPLPEIKPVDVQVLVNHVERILKPDMDRLSISFSTKCESKNVFMDDKLMAQVLINIFRNAMDAVKEVSDPMISVEGYENDNRYTITIADNGVGIDDNDLEKIFIPFYTTKEFGSGIGLSLSRPIVLMHKGELLVSKSEDGGSFFKITI